MRQIFLELERAEGVAVPVESLDKSAASRAPVGLRSIELSHALEEPRTAPGTCVMTQPCNSGSRVSSLPDPLPRLW